MSKKCEWLNDFHIDAMITGGLESLLGHHEHVYKYVIISC